MPQVARRLALGIATAVILVMTVGLFLVGTLLDAGDPGLATPTIPGPHTSPQETALGGQGATPSQAVPSASPAPTSSAAPTAPAIGRLAGTPGPRAAQLPLGDLTYTSAACFRVQVPAGASGSVAGAAVDFSTSAVVPAGERDVRLWLLIRPTGLFNPEILLAKAGWTGARTWVTDDGLLVRGPVVRGGTTRLTWRLVFATPIDAAYNVIVAAGPAVADGAAHPGTGAMEDATAATWSLTTAIDPCP